MKVHYENMRNYLSQVDEKTLSELCNGIVETFKENAVQEAPSVDDYNGMCIFDDIPTLEGGTKSLFVEYNIKIIMSGQMIYFSFKRFDLFDKITDELLDIYNTYKEKTAHLKHVT